jgi:hypothetical protein
MRLVTGSTFIRNLQDQSKNNINLRMSSFQQVKTNTWDFSQACNFMIIGIMFNPPIELG